MRHEPSPQEQEVIDDIVSRCVVRLVPIRLTQTMLKKSIIDAREALRDGFRRAGLVDYGSIPQGPAGKIQLRMRFVVDGRTQERIASFYRPATKEGDPRIWVERLASEAAAGDLLLFGFEGGTAIAILLAHGRFAGIAQEVARAFPSRYEERGRIEGVVRRLHEKIGPLAQRWVRTMRPGPTGVGYTFETLLGISANSSKVADVDGVELKSYRRGALTGPGKLVTLFSKTPTWLDASKGAGLLRNFGYRDANNRLNLYCTIMRTRNTLGFRLATDAEQAKMLVQNAGRDVMSYTFATLEKRLAEKHPATLFVRAESRGAGAEEEFRYSDVTYCRQPSFANFLDLVGDEAIGLDLTLHLKESGRARDHGYLWRVRESRIPNLFAYRRVLTATV